MLCAAVNNQDSFESVRDFSGEIKAVNPRAPILLIGTKVDLRDGAAGSISTEDLNNKSLEHGF